MALEVQAALQPSASIEGSLSHRQGVLRLAPPAAASGSEQPSTAAASAFAEVSTSTAATAHEATPAGHSGSGLLFSANGSALDDNTGAVDSARVVYAVTNPNPANKNHAACYLLQLGPCQPRR